MISAPREVCGNAALLLLVVAAGCGGGSSKTEAYSIGPTQACLSSRGAGVFTTDDEASSFAESGTKAGLQFAAGSGNDALALDLSDIKATIVFASSAVEAERIATRNADLVVRASASADPDELVVRRGNTVVLWSRAPAPESEQLVDECLSES